MKEKIRDIEEKVRSLKAETAEEVEQWRIKLLGKKGEITALFEEFRTIPGDQKRLFGQALNKLKNSAQDKINELKSVLGKAEVIDIGGEPGEEVVFGRTVVLYSVEADDEVTYQLVGPYESDPEKGRISVTSPLGQSLIGRGVGDEVKAKTPGGIQEFEILEIN